VKTRILFQALEIQELTTLGVNAGSRVVDIVMRGDTPHAVIAEPILETRPDEPQPSPETITLRMVAPGEEFNANETYVGSFFARRFVVVLKVK